MITALAITVCVIELWATYMGDLPVYAFASIWQVEITLLAFMGVFSNGSQRDRSVLSIMAIWFAWVLVSDVFIEHLSAPIAGLETLVFSAFVLWALVRPYFYVSADISLRGENVYIGFYQGAHAPFLSSLGALFGLPFSSLIIVAGDTVLRSSGNGKMVINSTVAIRPGSYMFIDTGEKATQEIFEAIAACAGRPTKAFGTFRTKCITNCDDVLGLVGLRPKSWFHQIPSIFYYQVVRGS